MSMSGSLGTFREASDLFLDASSTIRLNEQTKVILRWHAKFLVERG